VVSILVAARLKPELVDTKAQLVFADQYGMDGNHFTALWDRIGAWAPRRLVLDPWKEGECRESLDSGYRRGSRLIGPVGNAIHSVNAGASLLSAVNVKKQ
jgi:hypothetical protein